MSYVRVSILGTVTGGEVWSVNPTFDPTGEFPGGVDQAKLDSAANAIANINPGGVLETLMSTEFQQTGARVEVRDDATDELIGISIAYRTTPRPGTGTVRLPSQSAVVLSLRTNTPGGSGRGRLYWPAVGASLSTGMRLNSTQHALVCTDFKTYLLAQRSALATAFTGIGFDLSVRSKLTKTTPHVVRIQAGDVIDTQRRRRDKFSETYLSATFP